MPTVKLFKIPTTLANPPNKGMNLVDCGASGIDAKFTNWAGKIRKTIRNKIIFPALGLKHSLHFMFSINLTDYINLLKTSSEPTTLRPAGSFSPWSAH